MKRTGTFALRPAVAASGLVAACALVLAACSSSSGSTGGSGAGSGSSTTSSAVVVKSAHEGGLGTVLVDGDGRTLYVLSSEQGGKVTCASGNGCTNVWPALQLPQGAGAAMAGPGIEASLLGTVRDASGQLRVTYGGWPLYTYAGDSAAGQASGEGISSFGGTWDVLGVSGAPVMSSSGGGPGTSTSTTAGYRY